MEWTVGENCGIFLDSSGSLWVAVPFSLVKVGSYGLLRDFSV